MQIPVMIEQLPGNRFRATSAAPMLLMVEGDSIEESLRLWHDTYAAVLPADAEVVRVEPPSGHLPPWARFIGDLKDDPLVEVWRECLEEYRTQRDVEAGIEPPSATEHPLARFAGRLKDDPLFDEWQAAIEEYRQQCDVEAGLL